MTRANHRLVAVANGQLGSITRAQANGCGVSDKQLRSRVQSGFLIQTGPNAFRLPGADGARQHLASLVLDVGGDVVASRFTAAALLGFDGYALSAPFDLTIGRERRVRRTPHRIHTAHALPLIDRTTVDGVPTTRAARTIIDLARHESPDHLSIALESALRDGLVSEAALHTRIVALRSQGMHGIPNLIDVIEGIEISGGAHSWLEREFLRLARRHGLPIPKTQQVMAERSGHLVRVDFHFPGTDVVVEVLGYRWHRTARQLRIDTERMNALINHGLRPYQFTYAAIVNQPESVMRQVEAAVSSRTARAS